MKRIFTILVCALVVIGATSCGNGNSSKKDKGEITSKDMKALEKLNKQVKQTVQIKGNEVIQTTKAFGNTDSKVYTFDGDKCVGMRQILEYTDQKMAQELYEMAKEIHSNVKIDGKTVSFDLAPNLYEWQTEGKDKKQLRDLLQAEIDESK